MGSLRDVLVPDIGDFKSIPVIEVLVKPGDTVKAEDSLITLESDKATMEVPAPFAGVVKEMKIKPGDKVSEGMPILSIEISEGNAVPRRRCATKKPAPVAAAPAPVAAKPTPAPVATPSPLPVCNAHRRTGLSVWRTPARRYAASRANSASISARSKAVVRKQRILKDDIADFRQVRAGATVRRNQWRRHVAGFAGLATGGFRQVRPGGKPADVAHQENFRAVPASQLGSDSACHAERRSRHHRTGSLPQTTWPTRRKSRASSSRRSLLS